MMPLMNFDLEDGLEPVSFTLKQQDSERFMDFMADCTRSMKDAQSLRTQLAQSQAEKAELVRQCAEIVKQYEKYPREERFELINFAILSLLPKE